MVFVCANVSAGEGMRPRLGFAFPLSRLVARLCGRRVCRAKWSVVEAYGVCLLVFGINWVCAGWVVPLFVRGILFQLLVVLILPVVLWLIFLLLYYLISLLIRLLRRLGLYSAPTNEPGQHFFFVCLTTFLSLLLLQSENLWLQSLGGVWLALLGLNLVALALEKAITRD